MRDSKKLKKTLWNNMTFVAIVALLLLLCGQASGQSNADNYSFFKLAIFNPNKEVLLMTYQGVWELPGKKYQGSKSIKAFLEESAKSFAINNDTWQLNGLFTFHFDDRPNPTIMQYYSTNTTTAQPVSPIPGEQVQWFSIADAEKVIPYDEMKEILLAINSQPGAVFGGSYEIKGKGAARTSIVKDSIYVLNIMDPHKELNEFKKKK